MHARSSARLKVIPVVHDGQRELQVRDREGRSIKHWYIRSGDCEQGPFTPWAIQMALRAGQIIRDTLIRREDHSEAIAACLLDELFDEEDIEQMSLNELRHQYAT